MLRRFDEKVSRLTFDYFFTIENVTNEKGVRRGQWITASQHNDKWLCTDCGHWLPMYVNGVRVLEPLKETKNNLILLPPPKNARLGRQGDHLNSKGQPGSDFPESSQSGPRPVASQNTPPFSCGVKRRAFCVTKTNLYPPSSSNVRNAYSVSPHRDPSKSASAKNLSPGPSRGAAWMKKKWYPATPESQNPYYNKAHEQHILGPSFTSSSSNGLVTTPPSDNRTDISPR